MIPTLVCQGSSFHLNYLVIKEHNSKTIAFRVMSACLATAPCHDEQVVRLLHNNNNSDKDDQAIMIV